MKYRPSLTWTDIRRQRARLDRDVILASTGGVCGICGHAITGGWTIDHVIPISRGGRHVYENVQPSHYRCNNKKGNQKLFPRIERATQVPPDDPDEAA